MNDARRPLGNHTSAVRPERPAPQAQERER
jgi:hypothetical protein